MKKKSNRDTRTESTTIAGLYKIARRVQGERDGGMTVICYGKIEQEKIKKKRGKKKGWS